MDTSPIRSAVELDGTRLSLTDLVDIANGYAQVTVAEWSLDALDVAHAGLLAARDHGAVYGANTGVGANRTVSVPEVSPEDAGSLGSGLSPHSTRLLRSHCAGLGTVEDEVTARAVMVIRLNQFLGGGSGISGETARALLLALQTNSVPTIHRLGALGTGDLAAMAELALTLTGERPWMSGGIPPIELADSDALPFMSSSALTIATAAMAAFRLRASLKAATVIASLSFLALDGSAEAYDPAVQAGRPHAYQGEIAQSLRRLIGAGTDEAREAARIQDPFGLRAVPQVHAPAYDAVERLIITLEMEINAAAENPLVVPGGVRHHAQFHLATLAAVLDAARIAIYPVLTLSSARLALLMRADFTAQPPFLAADRTGSSGLMISEYVVQDALADVRGALMPVSGGTLLISLGVEEHASYATQGTRRLWDMSAAANIVLGVEAVAAVRALRMSPDRMIDVPAREAYEMLAAELDPGLADRPIGPDVERAIELLAGVGEFFGDGL